MEDKSRGGGGDSGQIPGQAYLNHIPIQKGKDPLGALRTKPQTSDLTFMNQESQSINILLSNPSQIAYKFEKAALFGYEIFDDTRDIDNEWQTHSQSPDQRKSRQLDENTKSLITPSNANTLRDEKSKEQSIYHLFGKGIVKNTSSQAQANTEINNEQNKPSGNNIKDSKKSLAKQIEDNFMELKKLKIDREYLVKGEELKTLSETSLKFGQYFVEGKIILTNYQVIFSPADEDRIWKFIDRKDYLVIPLGLISKVERIIEKKGLQYSYIDITCKDHRYYRFKYQPNFQNVSYDMQIKIYSLAFPEDVKKMFCYLYLYYDSQLENQYKGWQLYDIQKEFNRQGLIIAPHNYSNSTEYDQDYKSSPFKYIDNQTGGICSTYPPWLVVPNKMPMDEIIRCSRFRSRERLPALSFAFKARPNSNYTTMWRCAQCKLGINQNRSDEDEAMFRVIGCLEKTSTTVRTVKIYDARPYINAVGQQITGKGYEMKQFYKNCEIEFLDIHNIHKVRDSYKKMASAIELPANDYLREIDKSEWLIHISSIIYGTRQVIESLLNEINVVIHCSDGWDRTSQLICLAQICIDPYFRTIEGFEVLIEKDWIQFGHQFGIRQGHGSKNSSDDHRSPIFLQFLDCVYQLTEQFPLSFEFSSKFLADIAYHMNTCRFGTFLFSSYQEQIQNKVQTSTISLWSFLNSQKATYFNPYFLSIEESNLKIIFPEGHIRRFSIWKEHFMVYQPGYCDTYHIYNECKFTEDNVQVIKRITQMRYDQFKEENKFLKKKLADLEHQLANPSKPSQQSDGDQLTAQKSQQVLQKQAFITNPMMTQQQSQTKESKSIEIYSNEVNKQEQLKNNAQNQEEGDQNQKDSEKQQEYSPNEEGDISIISLDQQNGQRQPNQQIISPEEEDTPMMQETLLF